jgi:hypothetical protein
VGQRAFGLVQSGLVGPGVDHHDGLALLHLLALGELDRLQLAADPRLHRNAHVRRHRAQRGQEDGHRLLLGGATCTGTGRLISAAAWLAL